MGSKYLGRQGHEAGETLVGDDDCVGEAVGRMSVGNLCKTLQKYTRGSMSPYHSAVVFENADCDEVAADGGVVTTRVIIGQDFDAGVSPHTLGFGDYNL